MSKRTFYIRRSYVAKVDGANAPELQTLLSENMPNLMDE